MNQDFLRVMLYSHDTFGLGHLRRNLAIIERLLSKRSRIKPLLITGSPVQGSWPFPKGLKVLPLPPVVKVGEEKYLARNSDNSFESIKAERENLIVNEIKSFNPDLLLVDHAPTGMKGELIKAFDYLKRFCPETKVILGLRDILDRGQVVRNLWKGSGIYDILENTYDSIWVYGCEAMYNVCREYEIQEFLRPKIRYSGYVVKAQNAKSTNRMLSQTGSHFNILVTAGGGEDGYFIFRSFLNAIQRMQQEDLKSTLVLGPLMSDKNRITLEQTADQIKVGQVVLLNSTTELTDLINQNDLIIAMGGYNTSAEILMSGKPAILIPRAAPREEQRIRSKLFGQMGLVWDIQPEEPVEYRLQDLIQKALLGQVPAQDGRHLLKLNGAEWVANEIRKILSPKSLAATV